MHLNVLALLQISSSATNERSKLAMLVSLQVFLTRDRVWGLHSTEVVFFLFTQQPRAHFLTLPKNYFDVGEI